MREGSWQESTTEGELARVWILAYDAARVWAAVFPLGDIFGVEDFGVRARSKRLGSAGWKTLRRRMSGSLEVPIITDFFIYMGRRVD